MVCQKKKIQTSHNFIKLFIDSMIIWYKICLTPIKTFKKWLLVGLNGMATQKIKLCLFGLRKVSNFFHGSSQRFIENRNNSPLSGIFPKKKLFQVVEHTFRRLQSIVAKMGPLKLVPKRVDFFFLFQNLFFFFEIWMYYV